MAEIDDIVGAWTVVRAKDEVLRLLNEAHVPCAPVKTAREVAHDPHLEARGFWVDIDHPRRGRTRVPISAIRLHAGGKPEIRSPAPTLGQHTEAVLAELLGLKAEELATLRAQRVTEPVRARRLMPLQERARAVDGAGLQSVGSFQGNTVISAFGASEAMSMET